MTSRRSFFQAILAVPIAGLSLTYKREKESIQVSGVDIIFYDQHDKEIVRKPLPNARFEDGVVVGDDITFTGFDGVVSSWGVALPWLGDMGKHFLFVGGGTYVRVDDTVTLTGVRVRIT